jgi:hypothetical protein
MVLPRNAEGPSVIFGARGKRKLLEGDATPRGVESE